MDDKQKIKVGKDSVVIGNVNGVVGDGSVIIGSTDSNGNVILNQSMAIGRNAKAGPDSIAIGAGAGAGLGTEIAQVLTQIHEIVHHTGDTELINSFTEFSKAISAREINKTKISTLWEGIKSAAALSGFSDLVSKVSDWIPE